MCGGITGNNCKLSYMSSLATFICNPWPGACDGPRFRLTYAKLDYGNHIEKLDPALVRPGRVDKKVKFQLADRDVTMQIYLFIFGQPTERTSKKIPQAGMNPSIE